MPNVNKQTPVTKPMLGELFRLARYDSTGASKLEHEIY